MEKNLRDWKVSLPVRIEQLKKQGVEIVDPNQIWIGPDIAPERINAGTVLYPGTRLTGKSTWLGPNAQVGTEGPATVADAILDERAVIASGYVNGAVLLRDAKIGSAAHIRPCTLIEEEASTAHAVGLKHTILLSFVTLGSLINFCDCLIAGGTSRQDHSEVGSGYIHFNFTPWGRAGDKATPSLIGDVVSGVFLRNERVFLGGAGGMIGPSRIGYGSVTAAGQVLRQDVPQNRLLLSPTRAIDREFTVSCLDEIEPRASKNLEYIAQLIALREWYAQVRLQRVLPPGKPVIEAAIVCIDGGICERIAQLNKFLSERGRAPLAFNSGSIHPCPLDISDRSDHVHWVKSLSDESVNQGMQWLHKIVQQVKKGATIREHLEGA